MCGEFSQKLPKISSFNTSSVVSPLDPSSGLSFLITEVVVSALLRTSELESLSQSALQSSFLLLSSSKFTLFLIYLFSLDDHVAFFDPGIFDPESRAYL